MSRGPSSIYIVNDGLQHVAVVSFGVGFIQMQVDDDLVNLRRDENQPGLPQVKRTQWIPTLSDLNFQDANVFLGGEPGSRLSVGGFQGCLYSLEVFIAAWRNECNFLVVNKSLSKFVKCGLCTWLAHMIDSFARSDVAMRAVLMPQGW